jgi:hypothetical protein
MDNIEKKIYRLSYWIYAVIAGLIIVLILLFMLYF